MKLAMNVRNNRSSNIELLRIVMMLGVIYLHYQNSEIGGGSQLVDPSSINSELLMLIKSFAICAVDTFVLITGFFSYKRKCVGIVKAMELLAQVSAFGVARHLISCVLDKETLTVSGILLHLLPRNWFIVIYVALHCILVYLNAGFERLSKRQARAFLVMMISLFAIWPTLVDMLETVSGEKLQGLSTIGQQGSEFGYTIVTFVLMYFIGAYIGKYGLNIGTGYLIFALAMCVLTLYVWMHWDVPTATEYCNPIIICEAAVIFLLFTRMQIQSRRINLLSKAAFTVYLIHPALLGHIGIARFINGSCFGLLLHIVISCSSIYFIGWIIWWVWDKITAPVWNFLNQRIRFQLSVETLEEND